MTMLLLGGVTASAARALPAQTSSASIPRQSFGSPLGASKDPPPATGAPVGSLDPPTAAAAPDTGAADPNSLAGNAAGGSAIPVSYLRQSTFSIPFNVAPDTVEVQLYVSIDRGASWHLYAQQRPDARRFRFRASQDGEYWFASRTLDRAGQGRPATVAKPERRVIVDGRQPRLTVQATVMASGDVQASWDAEDENLAPQTFRIGYRTDVQTTWQLVAAPPLEGAAGRPASGQVSWRPPLGSRALQVHVEVADAAGNWGVVEKQLPIVPGAGAPAGTNPSTPGTTPGLASVPTVGAGSLTSSMPAVPPTGGTNEGSGAASSPLATDTPGYDRSGTSGGTGGTSGSASSGGTPYVPESPVDLPGNERPRMTTSRKFSLDYDIESAGPGGVADVELWMTRDRGATWTKFGVDADKTSPFDVEVADDGIYGVRIVIISGSGLASTAPRPNDPADLWVGVDTVRPNVQLSSVSYGEGQKAGQLDIRWIADDQRFGPRPITLSYAETSAGPWTTIASGLPNTGQYFWMVDARAPKKVVLKVEARDEAGNEAQHELREPISLLGLSPSARVKGVQPK